MEAAVHRKVPRTMSTQHPDNARVPPWVGGEVIAGEAEVEEAFRAYSEYGVEEVMWDAEGKDVDTRVVRKLLAGYPEFFRDHVLGRDVYLTPRLPNPYVEEAEKKVFSETLESIPLAYDVARGFYGRRLENPPVFEVILPFTQSSRQVLSVEDYYERVVGRRDEVLLTTGARVTDLIGETLPKRVRVIPLVESMEAMLGVTGIVEPLIRRPGVPYLRVFLARSDPALNYGLVTAVLMVKIALSRLSQLENRLGKKIYPILGVGGTPFRGHLTPDNVERVLEEYGGVQTFTVQSSFKYDHEPRRAREAIALINNTRPTRPQELASGEVEELQGVIRSYTRDYQLRVEGLAVMVNMVSRYIPRRRARKLHIGLFGYSRSLGRIKLPRAITFTASLYTLGIPPELLGSHALCNLSPGEEQALSGAYRHLKHDLSAALSYVNHENLKTMAEERLIRPETARLVGEDLSCVEENLGVKPLHRGYDAEKHRLLTSLFLLAVLNERHEDARRIAVEAAVVRRTLG